MIIGVQVELHMGLKLKLCPGVSEGGKRSSRTTSRIETDVDRQGARPYRLVQVELQVGLKRRSDMATHSHDNRSSRTTSRIETQQTTLVTSTRLTFKSNYK